MRFIDEIRHKIDHKIVQIYAKIRVKHPNKIGLDRTERKQPCLPVLNELKAQHAGRVACAPTNLTYFCWGA